MFMYLDTDVATSNFKYLVITKDNIYAYKNKKELLEDLGVEGFKKDVVKVYKVKNIWAGNA